MTHTSMACLPLSACAQGNFVMKLFASTQGNSFRSVAATHIRVAPSASASPSSFASIGRVKWLSPCPLSSDQHGITGLLVHILALSNTLLLKLCPVFTNVAHSFPDHMPNLTHGEDMLRCGHLVKKEVLSDEFVDQELQVRRWLLPLSLLTSQPHQSGSHSFSSRTVLIMVSHGNPSHPS